MAEHHWGRLTGLAGAQHGLISHDQLKELKIGDSLVHRWKSSGRLQRLHPRVYAVAGAPATFHRDLRAALLSAGTEAVVSHACAAWLWEMSPHRPTTVEITVPRGRRVRLRGVRAHESSDLVRGHRSLRHGLPVTNPLRTLADLGWIWPAEVAEDVLDRALGSQLVTYAGVEWMRTQLSRRGRDGVGVLGRILDHRALQQRPSSGLLEPRMARLLRLHGLPPASFQHPVHVGGRLRYIDVAYPAERLAIEVDGYEKRTSPSAMDADLDRQNDLVAAGWTVLRFTWAMVVGSPASVAARIRQQLATTTPASAR